jgi:uncharacterized protein YigE (DUF2233 family)
VSNEKPWKKQRLGCLGRLIGLAAIGLMLLLIAGDYVFKLRSNASYLAFKNSKQPLQAELLRGSWKSIASLTVAELDHALIKQTEAPGASWKTLTVRRPPLTKEQKLVQALTTAEISVVEFAPQRYSFATSIKEAFALTTARERMSADSAAFSITANFRDPQGKPLGLVVHEGKQRNSSFPAWTGYFFVKDGKPWFGPKSLYEETPGVLQEAAQGYPSVMKNHTVFSYVDLAPNRYFDGNKITYRALAGMKQNGNIVFILSGRGGVMNVAEVSILAQKLNLQHATLLDGGRALQYSLDLGGVTHHFSTFNTMLEFESPELAAQKSPVYISVRPKG